LTDLFFLRFVSFERIGAKRIGCLCRFVLNRIWWQILDYQLVYPTSIYEPHYNDSTADLQPNGLDWSSRICQRFTRQCTLGPLI